MFDGTKLFFKNFKQKKRTYFMEFGMIVMVGLLVFGLMIYYLSSRITEIHNIETNGKQHIVLEGSLPELSMENADKYNVAVYNRFCSEYGMLLNETAGSFLEIVKYANIEEIPLDIEITGDLPKNDTEILVPQTILKDHTKVGDTICFLSDSGLEKQFVISGAYTLSYASSDVTLYKAFSCTSEEQLFTGAEVIFSKLRNVYENSEQLARVVGAEKYQLNKSLLNAYGYGENDTVQNLLLIVAGVFILLLLFGMIKGSMAMRTKELYREYAILRSVGVRKKKLILFSFSEGLWLGLLGGVFGSVIGFIIIIAAMRYTGVEGKEALAYLGESIPITFAISIMTTLCLTLLARLTILHKPFKLQICELFSYQKKEKSKEREDKKYKNPICAYIFTSMKRNIGRIVLSILLFSTGIFFFVCIAAMKMDMKKGFGETLPVDAPYNVKVLLNQGYSNSVSTSELKENIEKIAGVESVMTEPLLQKKCINVDDSFGPLKRSNAYEDTNGVFDYIYINVYSEEELLVLNELLTDGTTAISNGGCVLINYAYPRNSKGEVVFSKRETASSKKVGDSIEILELNSLNQHCLALIQNGDSGSGAKKDMMNSLADTGKIMQLEIRGIAQADLRYCDSNCPVLILSETYVNSYLEKQAEECGGFMVQLSADEKISDFRDACMQYSAVLYADYNNPNESIEEETKTIFGMLNGLVFIAIVSGFVNVVCTIMLEWEVSRKEFAILKAVGATKNKIIGMVALEKALICMSSAMIGTVVGVIFEKLLMKLVSQSIGNFGFSIPVFEISMAVFIMFVITALVTTFQSFLLKNMNISEVLKTEG